MSDSNRCTASNRDSGRSIVKSLVRRVLQIVKESTSRREHTLTFRARVSPAVEVRDARAGVSQKQEASPARTVCRLASASENVGVSGRYRLGQ